VSESPVFQRKGDNLEVEVPITVAEALGGADVEVPTLHGTKKLRVPRAPSTGRSSACAARARRCRGSGSGRHPLPLRDRRPARALGRAARAVDALSKAMNGNPRERLLREAAGRPDGRPPHPRDRAVDHDRGVFMISVAAELADMHPQTLRMYEARGLIEPKRSPKGTRLYSQADVERLRRIQEMTTEWGMNLAGVERVFELEEQLERMQRKVDALERARRGCRARSRGSRRSSARSRPRSCATRRARRRSCPSASRGACPDDAAAPPATLTRRAADGGVWGVRRALTARVAVDRARAGGGAVAA
jgi:MerR family transcriptional regulator/heat shock protein HspR